jgi:D-lactate dehydrogenase
VKQWVSPPGHGAVCIFVNDRADATVLEALGRGGTKLVALRCTGFNNVDLKAAQALGIKVVRVVDYSPNSVAEHAVALLMAVSRKIHRAYNRTRDFNFSLEGLMGFDLCGKTVAVIGTGKIGRVFAKIMVGFGCNVIGYDKYPSPEFEALGGRYANEGEIGASADCISLHCPLTPETHHIINAETLSRAKPGALLINTSRGGLIDTVGSSHRGAQERATRRTGDRRVRAGSGAVLPRPVRHHRRRLRAAAADHVP